MRGLDWLRILWAWLAATAKAQREVMPRPETELTQPTRRTAGLDDE